MSSRKSRKINAYIMLAVFTVVLGVFGILSLVGKKQKYSAVDNRNLSVNPPFSKESFFSGFYLHAIDSVYADNFPFRDELVTSANFIKAHRGYHPKKIGFYKTQGVEEQIPVGVDTALAAIDSIPLDSADKGPSETSGGVVIYDGRAMELFGGNNKLAKLYAACINKYQEELDGKATIYVAAVPSSIAFYPPTEYRKMAASEKNNIDQIYSNLNPGIKTVNAYDEIEAHRSQYIYFATDHHWTGLGAYYAYVGFCKSAGLAPIALESMTHKVKRKYFGSLYFLTKDERLKNNPDSVEYWMVPGKHTTIRYGAALGKGSAGSLYAEGASGGNSYGVFLGGDNPLMRIDNDYNKNGRKCVIIKNSYGNPFATYFTANYETVFVVDYRYYKGSLLDLINDNKIDDVIFVNGVFSANTSWHIQMMTKIMRGSGAKNPKPKNDSASKDIDSVKNNVNDSLKNGKKPGG